MPTLLPRRTFIGLVAAAGLSPAYAQSRPQHVPATDWMAALPGNLRLADLTIPGTHDSCARAVLPIACCQTMTISEQLDAGIRFFDIRCAYRAGALRLFHGPVPLGLRFEDDVRDICLGFLAIHPGETITLLLTNEGADEPIRFEAAMRASMAMRAPDWALSPGDPRLGDMRGKIVVIRRFPIAAGAPPMGIDATGWQDDKTFVLQAGNAPLRFHIQDEYVVPDLAAIARKWAAIDALVSPARPGLNDPWILNYCSGTSGRAFAWSAQDVLHYTCLPSKAVEEPLPETVAKGKGSIPGQNPRLFDRIRGLQGPGHLGTVMLDYPEFPGEGSLVDALIGVNFRSS